MNKSDHINELAAALSKAQAAIKGAVKDSANPFFKSNYADLESVWDACRKPLTDNGLSVVQMPKSKEGRLIVETLMMHSSGQWIAEEVDAKPAKDDAQAIGSCITYLRRYSLAAFAGVCQTDDDGNAATGKDAKKEDNKEETMTADELVEKMTTSKTIFELKARYAKYAEHIGKLSGEDKTRVIMAKDKRKIELDAKGKNDNNQ